MLILGLVSGIRTVLSPKGLALFQNMSLPELASGRVTEAQSRLLNEALLAGDLLAQTARIVDWLTIGDLGAQVRRGCDDWLFLREELDVQPHPETTIARRAHMVGQVAKILATRGISLVVAVIPDKSRIETAHLCKLRRPINLATRLERFNALASDHDVNVVNLNQVLSQLEGERYFRTDTHWNENGARAAADTLAQHLRDTGIAPPSDSPIEIKAGTKRERVGDLIRLAGLADVPLPLRPIGDWVAESEVIQPNAVSDDLLGDMSGPSIVVVGSSYSRNANFIGFLSAALAAPIGSMAQDGAKFAGAATAYFANTAFKDIPPRVIIWEIPERSVDVPFDTLETDWENRLAQGTL